MSQSRPSGEVSGKNSCSSVPGLAAAHIASNLSSISRPEHPPRSGPVSPCSGPARPLERVCVHSPTHIVSAPPPALVATSGALIIPGQGEEGLGRGQLTGEGVTLSPPSHGRSPFSHPGSHFPGAHAAVNHLLVGLLSPLVG